MTDRCKNITLAKTSFRPVIIILHEVHGNIFISFRKREKAEVVGELPTNPALERYFSSVENLHVHKVRIQNSSSSSHIKLKVGWICEAHKQTFSYHS